MGLTARRRFHRLYKNFRAASIFSGSLICCSMILTMANQKSRPQLLHQSLLLPDPGRNTKSLQWRCSVVLFQLRNQRLRGNAARFSAPVTPARDSKRCNHDRKRLSGAAGRHRHLAADEDRCDIMTQRGLAEGRGPSTGTSATSTESTPTFSHWAKTHQCLC